jgi:flagellin
MADITLNASSRTALLSLQNTQTMMTRTQGCLNTGLKVSSAIDDAVSYFQAKGLSDRASDFTGVKDGIDQGISALKATLNGLSTVDSVLKQIKGALTSYKTADEGTRETLRNQITDLKKQIDQVVNDSSYQGLNLLKAEEGTTAGPASLTVHFSSTNDKSVLKVNATPTSAETLGLFQTPEALSKDLSGDVAKLVQSWIDDPSASTSGTQTQAAATQQAATSTSGTQTQTDATQQAAASTTGTSGGSASQSAGAAAGSSAVQVSDPDALNKALDALTAVVDTAISQVRATSASMGGNVTFLQTRLDFTKSYTNTLQEGSGKLTLADLNEEGANLVALQTRQQIGIQSLSLAGQQQQSILSLLR